MKMFVVLDSLRGEMKEIEKDRRKKYACTIVRLFTEPMLPGVCIAI